MTSQEAEALEEPELNPKQVGSWTTQEEQQDQSTGPLFATVMGFVDDAAAAHRRQVVVRAAPLWSTRARGVRPRLLAFVRILHAYTIGHRDEGDKPRRFARDGDRVSVVELSKRLLRAGIRGA